MAEFRQAAEEGPSKKLRKLVNHYPSWAKRIRRHLRFLSRLTSLVRNQTP